MAFIVFGIDLGLKSQSNIKSAKEATENPNSPVTFWYFECSGRSALYATESAVLLTELGRPVQDVTPVPRRMNGKHYRAILKAFCEAHNLPWVEPQWLVITDLG